MNSGLTNPGQENTGAGFRDNLDEDTLEVMRWAMEIERGPPEDTLNGLFSSLYAKRLV